MFEIADEWLSFSWLSCHWKPILLSVALIFLVSKAVRLAVFGPSIKRPRAGISHILVKTEELCQKVKKELDSKVERGDPLGTAFAGLAKEYSICPSSKNGGSLNVIRPGEMVPQFDRVVFNGDLKAIHGPIETHFGHHLIMIHFRDL